MVPSLVHDLSKMWGDDVDVNCDLRYCAYKEDPDLARRKYLDEDLVKVVGNDTNRRSFDFEFDGRMNPGTAKVCELCYGSLARECKEGNCTVCGKLMLDPWIGEAHVKAITAILGEDVEVPKVPLCRKCVDHECVDEEEILDSLGVSEEIISDIDTCLSEHYAKMFKRFASGKTFYSDKCHTKDAALIDQKVRYYLAKLLLNEMKEAKKRFDAKRQRQRTERETRIERAATSMRDTFPELTLKDCIEMITVTGSMDLVKHIEDSAPSDTKSYVRTLIRYHF